MSTLKLETHVPNVGVDKSRSRIGSIWSKLTRPASEPPYKQLPAYHIRVVTIKPGTTQYPLRVKLRTIDPRQAKYSALSYTWDLDKFDSGTTHGPGGIVTPVPISPPTQTVLCGGTPVQISQNLHDALSQYRDTQSSVPVFVDVLCIDFNSPQERAAYLEIMGHIYARAASVIVWLGKKDASSDTVMLIMRKLVNAIDWRKMGDGRDFDFHDPRVFEEMGMEPPTLREWRQIRVFCHLRWFTRYWSFFELAVAKQALFLWGEACMEYEFLIDFGMILGISGWLEMGDESGASGGRGGERVGLTKMLGPVARLRSVPMWHPKHKEQKRWMHETYGLQTEQQRAWKFFEILLESAEAFTCRDPRDRLYAPLALVRFVYGGQPINKQWPRPDYRMKLDDVVRTFSTLVCEQTGVPSMLENYFGIEHTQGSVERRDSARGRTSRSRQEQKLDRQR